MPETVKSYDEANLLYFFWLPSGKDEFGFRGYGDAPLRPTTFYRAEFERTIAEHLRTQEKRLRGNHESLAGLTWRGVLDPQDCELGLRKIEFSFEYEPDRTHLPGFVPTGPMGGTAMIFSNGLHLWAFRIRYERDTPEDQVRDSLFAFLRDDFVQHHVDRLFAFGWPNADLDDGQPGYDGILTYYQLDLLFNCVFDAAAHPHLFLQGDRLKETAPKGSDMYSIGSIVRSLSLAGFKRDYEPLWDLRKNYSFRGALSNGEKVYLDTDVDLFAPPLNGRYDEEREKLLSRLTFAAMEQFLRIAVPFGVTQYKAGLDHCKSELVSTSLLARRNHGTKELRRPSLQGAAVTVSEVEAYHDLIAGKVPSLEFLHGLVDGLSIVSEPLQAPDDYAAHGSWVEWAYGKSTLFEALSVFKRYIDVIKTELVVIDNSLAITRTETMLSELADTRKLAELEAESATRDVEHTVIVPGGEWGALELRLAVFAIALGFFEIYSNFGVWLTQSLFADSVLPQGTPLFYKIAGFAHWLLMVVVVVVLFLYFRKRYITSTAAKEAAAEEEAAARQAEKAKRPESHVFDYSFLRELVNSKGLSEAVVTQLKGSMINLQDVEGPRLEAVSYSTFREMPISGTERVKYSLESSANASGLTYLLHIEVDRRKALAGEPAVGEAPRTELLRNVRLVVRVPRDAEVNVMPGATEVIGQCVRSLVLAGKTDHDVRSFFESHFGWDWP